MTSQNTPTTPASTQSVAEQDALRSQVREGYAEIARAGSWSAVKAAVGGPAAPAKSSCCGPTGGCCGPSTISNDRLAEAIGYATSDLAAIPGEANLGLSCGNPTALAALRPGEVVLDLGAGAGFDCFIAAPRVGPTGRVIGVDMTPDMLSRARRNIASFASQTGLRNVEFRLGEIEALPVADASVDVVISNCVLNLSPDKPRVWREIARVLRPGGRVSVSDLALLKPLPEAVRADVEALVGCIAGASLVDEIRADAAAAGLTDIVLTPKAGYIEALTDSGDPLFAKIRAALPAGASIAGYVTSLDISARKA